MCPRSAEHIHNYNDRPQIILCSLIDIVVLLLLLLLLLLPSFANIVVCKIAAAIVDAADITDIVIANVVVTADITGIAAAALSSSIEFAKTHVCQIIDKSLTALATKQAHAHAQHGQIRSSLAVQDMVDSKILAVACQPAH